MYFAGRVGQGWTLAGFGVRAERDAELIERRGEELAARVCDAARPWTCPTAGELDSQSLGSWLDGFDLDPVARSHRNVWTTIDYGVEPERLSLLMWARDERLIMQSPDRGPAYVAGGLDQLPRALAAVLGQRVQLGCPVRALRQASDSVTVQFGANGCGPITARYAIAALPLGPLRAVTIDPPLDDRQQQALAGLRYGHVLRTHLQFKRRFWQDGVRSSGLVTDLPLQSAWDSTHAQLGPRGILTVYTAGRTAERLASWPEEARTRWCLDQLEQVYPGCRTEFQHAASVVWSVDPASLGAYSHFGPQELTRYGPWLARPAGRLHFAGEHTDRWQATMNGALASGERAADEVLARLRE
jgi:monoamine oxidase